MDEKAKIENRELPEWEIPVTWEMCGKVKVRAATIEEAMEIAKDEEGVIPLPDDGDYVDGSWHLSYEDAEEVRELYNSNQQDLAD